MTKETVNRKTIQEPEENRETIRVRLDRIIGESRIFGEFGCINCGEDVNFKQLYKGSEIGEVIKKSCEKCGQKYFIVSKVTSVAFEYNGE